VASSKVYHWRLHVSISVQIAGKNDSIPADVFLSTLEDLMSVIRDVDSAVSGRTQGSIRWGIAALQKNSPALVEFRGVSKLPKGDFTSTVQLSVVGGLDVLTREPRSPQYYSYSALTKVRRIAVKAKRMSGITIFSQDQTVTMSQTVVSNIDYLIGSGSVALGSIRGSLDSVTVHHGNEFRIWTEGESRPVTCRFRQSILGEVVRHLKSDVEVFGELRRNSRGEPIYMSVEEFFPVTPLGDLPSIEKMSGLVKNLYGGLSLKEHLAELRDE
jgi:hypothetical protein